MQAFQTRRNKQDAGDIKMLRVSLLLLFSFFFMMPTTEVKADWHSFWDRVHLDRQRNNCWPMPFQKADRMAVCQTLSVQLAKGWKRQNTISDVYFNQDTQELNEAGRRKLWAIMSTSPEQYRTIYVVQSMNEDAQTRRKSSIELAAQQLFKNTPTPEIVPVRIAPRSWSADYIDNINRKVDSTIPAPRLPSFEDTTGNN